MTAARLARHGSGIWIADDVDRGVTEPETGVSPRGRFGRNRASGTRIGRGSTIHTKSRMLRPMAPRTALDSNVFFFVVTEL